MFNRLSGQCWSPVKFENHPIADLEEDFQFSPPIDWFTVLNIRISHWGQFSKVGGGSKELSLEAGIEKRGKVSSCEGAKNARG